MLRFRAFLAEMAQAEVASVLKSISAVQPDLSVSDYGVQFVLSDGTALLTDKDEVHAKAVYRKSAKRLRLVDVLEAGIVRQSSASNYQVGARISDAQAHFMVDRALMKQQVAVWIGIAYTKEARSNDTMNNGVGPIEINDEDSKTFDLDRGAKAASIRAWVNSHF